MSKIVFDGRLSTKEPQKPPCLAHICGFPDIPSIAMRSCVGHRPLELATTTGKAVHSRAGIRNVISTVHTGRVLLWAHARLSLKAGNERQISFRGSTMFIARAPIDIQHTC